MPQPACPYPASEPASREKVRLGKEKEARRVSQCVAMLLASFTNGRPWSPLLVNASRSTQTQKPGLRVLNITSVPKLKTVRLERRC